jgi:predicted kinase
MFEYEGNEYSLEDVKQAASNLDMGFDEYVKKYNLKEKGKANGVAQQDATVAPQPEIASENMDLEPENGSLDLKEIDLDTYITLQPQQKMGVPYERRKELNKERRKRDFQIKKDRATSTEEAKLFKDMTEGYFSNPSLYENVQDKGFFNKLITKIAFPTLEWGTDAGVRVFDEENIEAKGRIDGTVSELNKNPEYKEEIVEGLKKRFKFEHPDMELPDVLAIDNFVDNAIDKKISEERNIIITKRQEAKEKDEAVVDTYKKGLPLYMSKGIVSEEEAPGIKITNEILELEEQKEKLLEQDPALDAKIKAKQKEQEEIFKKIDENYTSYFDISTNKRLTALEKQAREDAGEEETMVDKSKELTALEKFYSSQPREKLKTQYYGNISDIENLEQEYKDIWNTVSAEDTDVYEKIKNTDFFKNLSNREKAIESLNYLSDEQRDRAKKELGFIDEDLKTSLLEAEALKTTLLLNRDPASVKSDGVTRFFESAAEATFGEKDIVLDFGTSKRKELDQLEKTLKDADIDLTKDQKENFERSIAMEVTEGVGAFVPELAKFAVANKAQGALGMTKVLGNLMKSKKTIDRVKGFMLGAVLEEAKFKAVTVGESELGAGAFFFVGGAGARALTPFRFTGKAAAFNPALEKIALAGVGGATASEVALVGEGFLKSLEGNVDFEAYMNENFGEDAKAMRRFAVNVGVFGSIGATGMKGTDWMSMSGKYKLLDKLKNDLSTGELNSSQEKQKINSIETLTRDIAISERSYDNLVMSDQLENKANAEKALAEGNLTFIEKRQAKKAVSRANANIDRIRRKVNTFKTNVEKSGILVGDKKLKVIVTENGKDAQGRDLIASDSKAEYISEKDGIPMNAIVVNISKMRPGVGGHELGHAYFKAAFDANPKAAEALRSKIETQVEPILDPFFKEATGSTFKEFLDKTYEKDLTAEEYVFNVVEQLSKPKFRDVLLKQGVLPGLKRAINNTANSMGLGFKEKDLKTAGDVLEFLSSIEDIAKRGSATALKKKFDQFRTVKVDGNKLTDFQGSEITPEKAEEARASKDLEASATDLIKKYQTNKEGMTSKELTNLKSQFVSIGVEAVSRWAAKKGVSVSAIKGNPEIAGKILDQLGSVTKNYKEVNPVTKQKRELSTYMESFLGLRVGTKIVEEYSRKLKTTSADADFVREIEDKSSSGNLSKRKAKEEAEYRDLIDVREFTPARIKKELLEEAVDVGKDAGSVSKLTYKTTEIDYAPKVAEALLDMPYDRATGKSTLNYGKGGGAAEVSRMQGLFRNIQEFKEFIKTMPEYNVAGPETVLKTIEGQEKIIDVSPDAKGYATGLNNKLLKLMYDKVNVQIPGISSPKGRSLGKTSQTQVWRLKPEFRKPYAETLRKLQQDIGITPAGELSIPMKAANRTKFGTLLQGLTKVYVSNLTNKIVRSKIEESGIKTAKGTKQVIADIAAGKSKRMASKDIKENIAKFKPSFLKDLKDIKMYEEGESDFYNALSSGMSVEKAFNSSFDKTFLTSKNGKPLKTKNDLIKSIEWITGEYDRASRALSKGTEPKSLQRFLYEQVSEQRAIENLKYMLDIGKDGIDFNDASQINASVKALEKAIGEIYKKKTDAELAEAGAFLVKSYATNAKVGSGLFEWAETAFGRQLELSNGKTGTLRQSIFGKAEDFIDLIIKPNMTNPESIKVVRKQKKTKEGPRMDFSHVEFNGERIDVERAKQSSTAVKAAIKEVKESGVMSKETLDTSLDYANSNRDLFVDILEQFKENGDRNASGMFLSGSTSSMEGILRAAANLNSIAIKGKDFNPDNYRYEHNPPANVMKVYAVDYLNGNITKAELRAKLNDYNASIIPKEMDNIINEKYQSSLPLEAIINTWKRYYNFSHYGRDITELTLYEKQADGTYTTTRKGAGFEQAYKDAQSALKQNTSTKASKEFFEKPKSVQESIENLKSLDKALKAGNDAKAPVKKIRVFDFDDTLARSNSKVNYTAPNVEGGFSQGANKYKAIFMVGGPGAGKTNIGKGLQLGRRGYKVVNQDIALEAMKAESGLPAKESEYNKEQRSMRSKLGAAARKAAVAKFDKYAKNGDGMVIDGTGASYNATMKKVKQLEDAGFEVHMVVANTPLETAISRNKARVERSLPDFVVRKTWEQVQESAKKYREDFSDRLYEIETTDIGFGEALPERFLQKVYSGITRNKVGKINASEFAKQSDLLESQGAKFDFREFSKVIDGEKGPLFSVAEKIAAARGTEDVFILTARPPESAVEIQKFMKESGISIPLENITGLGDGTAKAKAKWVLDKAGEGYNDFYFADDAIKNVKAVKDILGQIDVKSKVQQAKASKDIDLSKTFNEYLELKTGIGAQKKYARVKGEVAGKGKGKLNFFVPYSANDFTGLLYTTLAKGKKGEAQMQFYKETMLDPYARAMNNISRDRIAMLNDFNALKKANKLCT